MADCRFCGGSNRVLKEKCPRCGNIDPNDFPAPAPPRVKIPEGELPPEDPKKPEKKTGKGK